MLSWSRTCFLSFFLDCFLGRKRVFLFSYFLVFFYKFPLQKCECQRKFINSCYSYRQYCDTYTTLSKTGFQPFCLHIFLQSRKPYKPTYIDNRVCLKVGPFHGIIILISVGLSQLSYLRYDIVRRGRCIKSKFGQAKPIRGHFRLVNCMRN